MEYFPLYSCAWLSNSSFVVGGGGGTSSRSGILNGLSIYDVITSDSGVSSLSRKEHWVTSDAIWSMSLAKVRSPNLNVSCSPPEHPLLRDWPRERHVFNAGSANAYSFVGELCECPRGHFEPNGRTLLLIAHRSVPSPSAASTSRPVQQTGACAFLRGQALFLPALLKMQVL